MVLQTPQPSQIFQHHPSDMHHAGVIPLNQPHTPPDPYRPPFANNLHPLPFMNGAYPPPLPQHEQLQQPPLPYLPPDSDASPHLLPMHPPPQPFSTAQNPAESTPHQVIDLTGGSPSPEPQGWNLPPDLPPKTPVCIGQLAVTALVLYPVNYLNPGGEQPLGSEKEWAPVRLNYEHNPSKASGQDTINIRAPTSRGPLGESLGGETFGVVEQKIASTVGPMLGKGLIRLEGKVRKGYPNVSSRMDLFLFANFPFLSSYLSYPSYFWCTRRKEILPLFRITSNSTACFLIIPRSRQTKFGFKARTT